MIYADEFSCTLLQPHVLYTSSFDWLLLYGSVSQGLGTNKCMDLIG